MYVISYVHRYPLSPQATAATLDTLMMATLDTQAAGAHTQVGRKKAKAFASAWHGAAAYHFYMLAQKQFYSGTGRGSMLIFDILMRLLWSTGQLEAAMKTSIKCCDYYDVLSPKDIYSLLCLTSLKNKFYGICSKAFVKVRYTK
jgi:WD repeat-containing protein 35